MNLLNFSSSSFLKYIFYLFPLLIIIGNAAINFAYLLIVLIYFYQCFEQKKILYKNNYEFYIFVCFYIYLIINSILSENITDSLLRTIPYIKYFILIIVFKNLINEKKIILQKLGLFWFLIIFALGLDIIYQSINGYDIFNFQSKILGRNSGFFFDELISGGFLVCFAFLTFFLIFKNSNKFYLFLYLFFFITVIFLTGERSNFLKSIFILSCLIFYLIKLKFIHKIFTSIISIFLLIFFLINFDKIQGKSLEESSNIVKRYISSISFSTNQDLNIIDKYLTSEYGSHTISAYLIFKDNFLFGVGNKNFRSACQKYKDKVIQIQKNIDGYNATNYVNQKNYPSGCATHPHQIYNEILSEHGIFGIIILTILFFKLFSLRSTNKKLNNLNYISIVYLMTYFLPILPSGSFFSTIPSTFFWINYLFYIVSEEKK